MNAATQQDWLERSLDCLAFARQIEEHVETLLPKNIHIKVDHKNLQEVTFYNAEDGTICCIANLYESRGKTRVSLPCMWWVTQNPKNVVNILTIQCVLQQLYPREEPASPSLLKMD